LEWEKKYIRKFVFPSYDRNKKNKEQMREFLEKKIITEKKEFVKERDLCKR